MLFSYPIIDKPFKFEGFKCFPSFFSHHYSGSKHLYFDMFHPDGQIEKEFILDCKFLPKFAYEEINIPFEWFDTFEGIEGRVEKIGTIYYRYACGKISFEEAGDACYMDFPKIDKRKAGFIT